MPYAQGGDGYDVWQEGQKGVAIRLRIFALPSAIQVSSHRMHFILSKSTVPQDRQIIPYFDS